MERRYTLLCLIAAALVALPSCDRREKAKPFGPAAKSGAETQEKILKIVATLLGVEPCGIDPGKQLTDPGIGADDLDIVEIIMEVEDTFDIQIPDDRVTDPKTGKVNLTVEKLVGIVESMARKHKEK